MNKVNKKNNKIYLVIVGILLFIIALLINRFTIVRLLLTIVGIILVTWYFSKDKKFNFLMMIILIVGSIGIDSVFSSNMVRIPIYAYNVTTNGDVKVYNGIGFRIWQCNKNDYKNLKLDKFYTKGYNCDVSNIETIDSNVFLNSVIENYVDYENTYVKIKGKISKKNSRNSIEMQPYEQNSITINGYVSFADNITLKILFYKDFEELDLYDIYDEITVVGIVKTLEHHDDSFVIYLTESLMIDNTDFNKYELLINEQSTCDGNRNIIYTTDKYNVYTYCLQDIFVDYNGNKYELSSALSSSKITIESLFKEKDGVLDANNNTTYLYDKYTIYKCNPNISRDLIIAPKGVNKEELICGEFVVEEEDVS